MQVLLRSAVALRPAKSKSKKKKVTNNEWYLLTKSILGKYVYASDYTWPITDTSRRKLHNASILNV